jgi:hypothetical protein
MYNIGGEYNAEALDLPGRVVKNDALHVNHDLLISKSGITPSILVYKCRTTQPIRWPDQLLQCPKAQTVKIRKESKT